MANEYLRLQDASMNIEKAQNVLAVIEQKRKEDIKDVQSESNLFTELWRAFKDFFTKLGKPTLQKRHLKETSPAISSLYNQTMREIRDDMMVAYTEVDSLGGLMVKNHNYSESERQMLLNRVRKVNSKNIDYSFFSVGAKDRSLHGIDTFIDKSKIDYSRIGAGAVAAEVVTSQGVVTLARAGNIDRSPLVRDVTGIKESLPPWDGIAETGGYEGMYFGMKGEARPEGGAFHLEYTANGATLFDRGAEEPELRARRMLMFDQNPDTFWECELVSDEVVGYKNKYDGKQISVSEFEELRENELSSPNVRVEGGTIIAGDYGSLIEDYIPVTSAGLAEILAVDFVVHLDRSVNINWLNLNPNNFSTRNYIDIISIETSTDGEGFDRLDGFDDHEYDITLTTSANQELNETQIFDTLAPDRFKFAGQGVWTFAPRRTRLIKFSLRQPQFYIKPYEVLRYRTEQEIVSTTTKKVGGFLGIGASTKTVVDAHTKVRERELPYLEGIVSGFDVMGLDLGGEEYGERAAGNIHFFGVQVQSHRTVSEERIVKQWAVTKYDKARFAIGVRDIGIYSYIFSPISEVISKPFTSPKPIAKVSLTVDECVPKIFYMSAGNEGTENEWIKYFISVDDGSSWRRISPINHTATMSEDGVSLLPKVININSDISPSERRAGLEYIDTPSPVYQVRFKAVLSRPENISDSESFTPLLSKYALKIYPHGGL
jgi:hypothetical protein